MQLADTSALIPRAARGIGRVFAGAYLTKGTQGITGMATFPANPRIAPLRTPTTGLVYNG